MSNRSFSSNWDYKWGQPTDFILCHSLAQLQRFDLSKGQPGNKEMTEVIQMNREVGFMMTTNKGGGVYGKQLNREAGFMLYS